MGRATWLVFAGMAWAACASGQQPGRQGQKPEGWRGPAGRLGAKDPLDRVEAAWELGELRAAAAPAVPALVAALEKDPDAEVRASVIAALGKIGRRSAPATAALRRALGDARLDVRREAVDALGRIGPGAAEAAPDLLPLLRLEELRHAAARALGAIRPPGDQPLAALVELLAADPEGPAARALAGWDPARVAPALVPLLRAEAVEVRRAAAGVLADFQAPEEEDEEEDEQPPPPPPFQGEGGAGGILSFDSDDEPKPYPALGAEPLAALGKALTDPDEEVRARAAAACARLGPQGAALVEPLEKALQDPELRRDALRALSGIGPGAAAALPELVELLADQDLDWMAAEALGALGEAGLPAVPALVKAWAAERDRIAAEEPPPKAASGATFTFGSGGLDDAIVDALHAMGPKAREAVAELARSGEPAAKAAAARLRAVLEGR